MTLMPQNTVSSRETQTSAVKCFAVLTVGHLLSLQISNVTMLANYYQSTYSAIRAILPDVWIIIMVRVSYSVVVAYVMRPDEFALPCAHAKQVPLSLLCTRLVDARTEMAQAYAHYASLTCRAARGRWTLGPIGRSS